MSQAARVHVHLVNLLLRFLCQIRRAIITRSRVVIQRIKNYTGLPLMFTWKMKVV
jgi:hypothetical protein